MKKKKTEQNKHKRKMKCRVSSSQVLMFNVNDACLVRVATKLTLQRIITDWWFSTLIVRNALEEYLLLNDSANPCNVSCLAYLAIWFKSYWFVLSAKMQNIIINFKLQLVRTGINIWAWYFNYTGLLNTSISAHEIVSSSYKIRVDLVFNGHVCLPAYTNRAVSGTFPWVW